MQSGEKRKEEEDNKRLTCVVVRRSSNIFPDAATYDILATDSLLLLPQRCDVASAPNNRNALASVLLLLPKLLLFMLLMLAISFLLFAPHFSHPQTTARPSPKSRLCVIMSCGRQSQSQSQSQSQFQSHSQSHSDTDDTAQFVHLHIP